ncbi:hypothetical protein [Metabacillus sediminilitoris]|uniref:Uncharacterized protein n=1 Tax=Metabacillus sediminilitoris TaxID=2567941 RepID=A0A4S4BW93_9BACI|nr:hypothetical protein [Metabacillus sediminilitoris]QGQ44772.1 hypothetical protein GMB29_05505 [Metabacillus sediminilitoris]THF78880.1 hypothetical protein E6W99_14200 [Metabacillus sediminilitoris]
MKKSNLCNFELDLGYYNDFLIINKEYGEVIKSIVFPEKLFEKKFFGEKISIILCISLNIQKEDLAGLKKNILS